VNERFRWTYAEAFNVFNRVASAGRKGSLNSTTFVI
jgi:hypothetical protein